MSSVHRPDLVAASERATRFAELHRPGTPLLMANAWDAGSAKILAHSGYAAWRRRALASPTHSAATTEV